MSDGVRVDADRVRGVADALALSAEVLGDAADSVADAGFGTAGTGRNYGDLGAAYSEAHLGLGRAVRAWRSSVDDISDALTTAMNEYEQQDDATAYTIESHR
ncbi:type VII secretion target [Rhodococcus sp. IEGM 1330]|uniref:type VII secretion target n=1 Tax=Rhodococcus sp. IEGM 1330 TaxID=3082225 RepID=UPI002953EFEF|nr:type VII secretion target [Rhodococcus sp. IEGM 1330]MDV8020374.1 type VII secretion target [Rhodococcus sp. IEGM 1330]